MKTTKLNFFRPTLTVGLFLLFLAGGKAHASIVGTSFPDIDDSSAYDVVYSPGNPAGGYVGTSTFDAATASWSNQSAVFLSGSGDRNAAENSQLTSASNPIVIINNINQDGSVHVEYHSSVTNVTERFIDNFGRSGSTAAYTSKYRLPVDNPPPGNIGFYRFDYSDATNAVAREYEICFTYAGENACLTLRKETGSRLINGATVRLQDTTPPTMSITATGVSNGDTTDDASLALTFTANEPTTDFVETDITLSGGTLSAFTPVSSTVYTATFTPTAAGATSIAVNAATFTDGAGNDNLAATPFTWTYDPNAPTMSITATGVSNGDTTDDASLALTFTANEPTTDFVETDITLSGGTLSAFTPVSSTVYTATFTPTAAGATSIAVNAATFTDGAGNDNLAATPFTWTYDPNAPTMSITATGVSNGDTTDDASLALTFTANEPTTDFVETDITLSGGTLSAFTPVSSTVYTATFTPTAAGATSIAVNAATFTDGAGNDNLAATPFTWTYDPNAPTMSITATGVSNGDTTDDASLALTFTANEPTTDFVETDITLSGGTLSAFTPVSSTVYTATFTPTAAGATSIAVNAATFTDGAGNDNLAATPFTWTYDPNAPTMSITATGVSNGDTTDDASLALTFTANEPTTDFVETDITLSGGTLSAFTPVSSTVYTATFTPTAAGATSIAVNAATFTDGAGNDNLAATPFTWTYDPNAPTMSITATGVSNGDTTDDASLALTFTANEPTTDFVETDITLSGGTLSAFTPVSSTVYTATFTPTAAGATSIAVNAATFTDGAGNDNLAATPFTWTYDPNAPTMSITATGVSNGDTTDDASLALTFTANEPTTDFVETDITLSGGTLSAFTPVSSTVYTATFTPTAAGATSIAVNAATFTDGAGNDNLAATPFTWTYDPNAPTMSITATGVSNGDTTDDASLALTFTANEPTTDFVETDITLSGGTLSAFTPVSSTVYTATFTPTAAGATSIAVNAATFTDGAGNDNLAATPFTWTYDPNAPTMSITATGVSNGDTTDDASLALTFTANEPTTDFVETDITLSGGTLSAFTPVSSTVYTATFTPTAAGATSIAVNAATFTDGAGNDNLAATPFTWTYDPNAPTMSITATGVSNGDTTDDASLALTFTANEPTTDFVETDITLSGGTLSAFTPVSSTVYTATFTPTAAGATSIAVNAATFTDGAGNDNLAATPFTWTYDPNAPTMSITATGVSNGDTTDDASLALTFTANEPTTDFVETDITLSGGTLSAFTPVSSTVYTATFTPTAAGATSIAVNAATFTDGAGNDNLAATPFTWTYDPNAPTMSITATGVSNGDTTDDASLALTFTANEPTTDFVETDITLSGGTLSAFTPVSSTVYTATFTPTAAGATSIAVNAATFTDGAGNDNLAATPFTWTYDPNAPTMSITATGVSNGDTTDDASLALTFTANEPTTDFVETDITLSGGTLSAFTPVSSTVYTATFTPTAAGATSIAVNAATFTDGAGNDNLAATPFTWTYDPNAPTMSITATGVSNGDTTDDASLALTFTANEPTTDFVETDITLSGGTLSAFTPVSSTVYTATFTPTAAGATSIAVNAATFTDGAGNDNLAATPFTWTYDPNAPTMSITATGVSNGDTTDDASLALTFTANEPTTDFVETDITLSGGTLSAFTPVSSTVYTATFTPTAAGATSIAVNAATFTDGAGNDNLAATPFTWTYDPNAPTMSITATGVKMATPPTMPVWR